MINCIALDDEPLALEVIQLFCEKLPFLHLYKTFTNSAEALRYLQKHSIDLIFLDVQMPAMNGIAFAKKIANPSTMIIFTTAHAEYAWQGFELNAIDFLLKPIQQKRFEQASQKAKEYFEFLHQRTTQMNNALYVRAEYSLVKIPFVDILYLETMDDYIKIHQLGKPPLLTLMSMKKVLEKLPPEDFVRIHRSYIIPLNKIESVRAKSVFLGVTELPIGTSYEKEFFQAYMKQGF